MTVGACAGVGAGVDVTAGDGDGAGAGCSKIAGDFSVAGSVEGCTADDRCGEPSSAEIDRIREGAEFVDDAALFSVVTVGNGMACISAVAGLTSAVGTGGFSELALSAGTATGGS